MISSSSWDGKIHGGKTIPLKNLKFAVFSIKRKNFGRIAIATAVSASLFVSSARFMKEYEGLPNYGGLHMQIGTKEIPIEYMKYYNKYNPSRQNEFDIGIVKVSNLTNFKILPAKEIISYL